MIVMQSRNSRSYMSKYWKQAPPVVWLWVLLFLCVLGCVAVGAAVIL